jgi:hypothetical protein
MSEGTQHTQHLGVAECLRFRQVGNNSRLPSEQFDLAKDDGQVQGASIVSFLLTSKLITIFPQEHSRLKLVKVHFHMQQ